MDKKKKETLEELMNADLSEPEREVKESKKAKDLKKNWPVVAFIFLVIVVVASLLLGFVILKGAQKTTSKQTKTETTNKTTAPKSTMVTINATGGLNLRATPDSNGGIITVIPQGTSLTVISTSGDWDQVNYSNQNGWISKDYVTVNP